MTIERNIVVDGEYDKPILLDYGFISNSKKKPVVIFAHGFKGFKDWGHFNMVMNHFISAGSVFIKFNFSHNGGSVEQPIDFPDLEAFGNNNYTKELSDLKTVVNWVEKNSKIPNSEMDTSQIYLIGHSRGGGVAVLAANEDERIKKLVCWAPVADLINRFNKTQIAQWQKDGVLYIPNARTNQQMPLYYQLVEDTLGNEERFNIEVAAKNLKIPHLIIHGNADEAVDILEGKKIHKWSGKSELVIVENADHTFGAFHPYHENDFPNDVKIVLSKTLSFLGF